MFSTLARITLWVLCVVSVLCAFASMLIGNYGIDGGATLHALNAGWSGFLAATWN